MTSLASVDPYPVDVLPDGWDKATAIGTVGAVAVAVLIAVVEAWRAAKARRERDALASSQRATERRSTASLVSAWVERTYIPADDGTTYVPQVWAHIINGGQSPVYDVHSSVGLVPPELSEKKPISLGALSIPSPMAVLPPNSYLSFDLTVPLVPHRQDEQGLTPETPRLEVSLTDPNDVRWVRELDGRLVESERSIGQLVDSDDRESMDRQMGRLDELNPLAVVTGFLSVLGDEDLTDADAVDQLGLVLAPEAEGWRGLDGAGVASLREDLQEYGLAGHVSYPGVQHRLREDHEGRFTTSPGRRG